jgi:hypothetical protein
MRPIPAGQVSEAVQISGAYPAVHGAPVHVGEPSALGIHDLSRPDYGDSVEIAPGEVPVFWACGVTPQVVALPLIPSIMITHAPGYGSSPTSARVPRLSRWSCRPRRSGRTIEQGAGERPAWREAAAASPARLRSALRSRAADDGHRAHRHRLCGWRCERRRPLRSPSATPSSARPTGGVTDGDAAHLSGRWWGGCAIIEVALGPKRLCRLSVHLRETGPVSSLLSSAAARHATDAT